VASSYKDQEVHQEAHSRASAGCAAMQCGKTCSRQAAHALHPRSIGCCS
jgi:hypothetical protein